MGQARQRRLAKAAGKPWPEDLPKPAGPHAGQYLGNDGEWHRQGEGRPVRLLGLETASLLALEASIGRASRRSR